MKKIYLFFIAALFCGACDNEGRGCAPNKNDVPTTHTREMPYVYTKQIMLEPVEDVTYGQILSIRHFIYNGHEYIQFHVCGSHGGGYGIVHDPDCNCIKQRQNQ